MRWQKGQSGNPAGKKPGTKNRATSELRAKVRQLIEHNWQTIQDDIDSLEPKDRVSFIERLLAYSLPRLQSIELPEPAESHKHIDLSDVPTDILKELSDAKDKAMPYLKYKDDNGRNLPSWLADDGDLLQ